MTNESHIIHRTPGLSGYRPDEGTIQKLLRSRRAAPVHPRLTLEKELWLCVQFVTNEEIGITQLRDAVRVGRDSMGEILAGWGIDRKRRTLIPMNEAEEQLLAGRTAEGREAPLAA